MMYLASEKERTRTMLSGIPISAEGVRLSEQKLGAHWQGTSWFFLMHIIAKAFTKLDEIPFSSLASIPQSYGIENWLSSSSLRKQIDTLAGIFRRRGLESIETDKDGNLSIGGPLSSGEVKKFADSQYEYAMSKGLVRYSPGYKCWVTRSSKNFAERIWWHYMTAVFDSPRIYESPSGQNTLKATMYDITDRMKQKDLSFHGIQIWTDEQTKLHPFLSTWQRELIANNILKPFKVGDVEFIAPRYFAETYEKSLKANEEETGAFNTIIDLMDKLNKFPAFPIPLGATEQIDIAKDLQRANIAILVTESDVGYNIPKYAYIVSRRVFKNVEKKIGYSYSSVPMNEFGDITLTEQIFKTLGRLRLFGQKVLPETKIIDKDFRKQVEQLLDSLETKGESETFDLTGCLKPLESFNVISLTENKAVVNPEMEFAIKYVGESWFNLINDPTIGEMELPAKSVVDSLEHNQIKDQIEEKLSNYFT